MTEENTIKVILIGRSGTGKTNIIKAATSNTFEKENESTLSSSFIAKNITIDKKTYHVELWDTAGQEKYRSLTKMFIVFSKIVIFVYDITQRKSFEELDFWIDTVKEILGEQPVYALFGNKKDLFLNEEIEEEEGRKKAEEIGAIFRLTSAKDEPENINQYLEELVEVYTNKNYMDDNTTTLHREMSFSLKQNKAKYKTTCCKKG